MTIAPGKHSASKYSVGYWARDLEADLDHLVQHWKVTDLVCLLEAKDLARLQISSLLTQAEARGLKVHWLPMPDGGVPPDLTAVRDLVENIVARARANARIVIHCEGGLGRTGVIAGCYLVARGIAGEDALTMLRKARKNDNCPETEGQREFVRQYTPAPTATPQPEAVDDAPVMTKVREISQQSSKNPYQRHAKRVLAMVAELHKAGYQRLRVAPGMSPSGCYWRCYITSADNVASNGWEPINMHEGVAIYTTGNGTEYFGWKDAAHDSARQLAQKFIERFPEIVRKGTGRDWPYAGWFVSMLGTAEHGNFPIFFADYDLEVEDGPPPPLRPSASNGTET